MGYAKASGNFLFTLSPFLDIIALTSFYSEVGVSEYFLSVSSGTGGDAGTQLFPHICGGLRLFHGALKINGTPSKHADIGLLRAGDRFEIVGTAQTQWIRFDLSRGAPDDHAQLRQKINLPENSVSLGILFRMDEVKFPPGAIAYRHVHPGDGIRFLTAGELKLISDQHEEMATPGHAWFEPANSPVRAEASFDHELTSFVRVMVLPTTCSGQPTIDILDPLEATLERQQVTQRHIDEIVQLDLG